MAEPPDDLIARVVELERRVTALEHGSETAPVAVTVAQAPALPSLPDGIFAVLGRALLGIAGAYLLRAAAESGTVPRLAAVLAAVLYAAWWLVSSSRVAIGKRLTMAVYGLTAALVISPLLWETTVRLQVLRPFAAATILAAFVALGAMLAWPRNLGVITWITTLAGVATAVALIVATGEIVPFTAALLVMAVVVEYSACRDHWLGSRWVVALASNFAVFLLSYLAARPGGMPEGYAPASVDIVIGIQIALLAIYLGSTVYRTLIHHLSVTTFEIGQAATAFLISIGGAMEVTQRTTVSSTAIGVFSILSGAGCYLVAFLMLGSQTNSKRNLHTYSTFGLALVLTAGYVLTSGPTLVFIWPVVAVAAMWCGRRADRINLRIHAAAYLVAAAIVAALGDSMLSVAAVTAACAVCYAMAGASENIVARNSNAVIVAVFCWNILGPAVAWMEPGDGSIIATVRTALLCALAVACAWAGWRWNRAELRWLQYALMIAGAIKLFAEDFRQGRSATLWLSLVCYGGTLILAPRLSRPHVPEPPREQAGLVRRGASLVRGHGSLGPGGPH